MKFALIQTDGMMNSQCGVCGHHTDSLTFDVVVFGDGGPAPVCDECCEEHAIELMYVRSRVPRDLVRREDPKPDKQSLLDRYAHGTVQRCIRLDGHCVGRGDEIMIPDEDGHVLEWTRTWELRSTDSSVPVRVIVHDQAQCTDVVRIMRKLTDWVSKRFSATDKLGTVDDPLEATTVTEAWEDEMRREERELVRQKLKGI